MIQTIVKRDGRIVGFNEEKIKTAIRKAMLVTEKGVDEDLIQRIVDKIAVAGKEQMSVDQIQDQVELELMKSPRKEVAKCYIAYRNQRDIARKAKTREVFLEIIAAKKTDVTRENANMNADTPEREGYQHHSKAVAEERYEQRHNSHHQRKQHRILTSDLVH